MAHLSLVTMPRAMSAGPVMGSPCTQMSTLIVSYVTHGLQEMVQNNHPNSTRL